MTLDSEAPNLIFSTLQCGVISSYYNTSADITCCHKFRKNMFISQSLYKVNDLQLLNLIFPGKKSESLKQLLRNPGFRFRFFFLYIIELKFMSAYTFYAKGKDVKTGKMFKKFSSMRQETVHKNIAKCVQGDFIYCVTPPTLLRINKDSFTNEWLTF